MKKVGILGAGQLGCMLAECLFKFGAEVYFYDTQSNAPGFSRTPYSFCGQWNDKTKLKEFFSACDVVTYEFENVSIELLNSLVEETKTPLYPSAHVLALTQNRIHEKTFLKNNALPVCNFKPILTLNELKNILGAEAFPFIIKTSTGGYDGKGQWKLENKNDANNLVSSLSKATSFPELILEELVPIVKEVSCITARNKLGEMVCFPVFENEHRDHILYQTLLPAEIPQEIEQQVQNISKNACEKLNVIGLLTTEFFISKQNKIYVNEFAPRPHNSGHISRLACNISQFEILARILLDLPIHEPILYKNAYCMSNILGSMWNKNKGNLNLKTWSNNPAVVEIMLYGKDNVQEKRKMGHFIAVHNSRQEVVAASEKLRKEIYESQ